MMGEEMFSLAPCIFYKYGFFAGYSKAVFAKD
jgi:hypothetical protein